MALRPPQLLQDILRHALVLAALLGAPLALPPDKLRQLRNGLAPELLRAAVRTDLDVRDMLLQGLVLGRRLPQGVSRRTVSSFSDSSRTR